MENYFIASVLDGSNEYRDAIYILEDAVSDQWDFKPIIFPSQNPQFFLINELADFRSPKVIFFSYRKM